MQGIHQPSWQACRHVPKELPTDPAFCTALGNCLHALMHALMLAPKYTLAHFLSLCACTHELAHMVSHTCTHGIAHMHLYTWTRTHARMDSNTWTCTHGLTHMDSHTCIHGLAHMHIWTCTMHTWTHTLLNCVFQDILSSLHAVQCDSLL